LLAAIQAAHLRSQPASNKHAVHHYLEIIIVLMRADGDDSSRGAAFAAFSLL
jgi:hypothetical protein